MVWRRLLRLVALTAVSGITIVGVTLGFVVSASAACDPAAALGGFCDSSVDGTINGEEVVLTGSQPGGGNGGNGGGGGSGNGSGGGGGGTSSQPQTPPTPTCDPSTPGCQEWGVVTLRPTLSDIAAFRPAPEVDHMEPNGWFVVGLDANFFATGSVQVVDGTLLGYPASVRFTPIRWSWQYGDGSTATRSTRGGTWAALGIREFDPTPTSHVYERAGTYYIDLTVGYRAEYTFNGGSWGSIPGTLWLPANRLVATVGGAKTVLVERDCTTNPGGPGC